MDGHYEIRIMIGRRCAGSIECNDGYPYDLIDYLGYDVMMVEGNVIYMDGGDE